MAAKRPQPRRSTLTTQHPAAPAQAPAEDAKQQSKPESQPTNSEPPKKWRHKVSIYQDRDFTDRMRGAIIHTTPQEGARTLTDFINGAIEAELERLEAKYNDGKPFPPIGPKGLPQGRPMGTD